MKFAIGTGTGVVSSVVGGRGSGTGGDGDGWLLVRLGRRWWWVVMARDRRMGRVVVMMRLGG